MAAQINSRTFGSGNGGPVSVNADRLLLTGANAGGYSSAITSSNNAGSSGHAGTVTVTARELELRDGGQISSSTFGSGNGGPVSVNADRLLLTGTNAGRYSSGIFSSAELGSTGYAGTVTMTARELELHDGARIYTATESPGNGGPITVKADHLLLTGGDPANTTAIFSGTFGLGNGGPITISADRLLVSGNSVIASSAQTTSTGQAGSVAVIARELELRDGGWIASNTRGSGDGGQVTVKADRLLVSGVGAAQGSAPYPFDSRSLIASSALAGSTGAGGSVVIQARTIRLQNGGAITTASAGTGPGGSISVSATDTLRLDKAVIETKTETANGGDLVLAVGRLFDLHDSNVTTSVAGGTGSGGNIFVHAPSNSSGGVGSTRFLVLDDSRIQANAKQGAGGNITIQAGQLIRTPDSMIQASSELGLSGTISIAAPNTDVSSSLTVLPETFFDASSQLRVACAARGGRRTSSLTPSGRGGLPPDPGTPLVISPSGQPLEQQTATGSPTALTARPPQAVKPVMVAGTSQPVLGSPRLSCRG